MVYVRIGIFGMGIVLDKKLFFSLNLTFNGLNNLKIMENVINVSK